MAEGGPDRSGAAQPPLRVLATLAVQSVLPGIAADAAIAVDADFAPTLALIDRLRSGEAADLAILTMQGVDDLVGAGILTPGSRVDIALSYVGLAVRQGDPVPPIGTEAELRAALVAARSVCYSRIGASGVFFAALIDRMGIAAAVNAKARIIPSGFTAEPVARGEADIAVQQVSELLAVPGVTIVGRLPSSVQVPTMFSGALVRLSDRSGQAGALLRRLASPQAGPALARAGLDAAAG